MVSMHYLIHIKHTMQNINTKNSYVFRIKTPSISTNLVDHYRINYHLLCYYKDVNGITSLIGSA